MYRRIATHFVVLAVGLAIGVGAVAVADDQQPRARAAAPDSRIVAELRKLRAEQVETNEKLDILNEGVSGVTLISPSKSLRDVLGTICRNTNTGVTSVSC